jgi:phosphate-selective porin OprO/OprP
MNFSKLTLAIATTLGASVSFNAFAMDLYVDSKTKQIYAEPGRGRELMGAFERISDKPLLAPAAPVAAAELATVRQDLELKTNEIKALQEHMEEAEKVKMTVDNKGLSAETADKNFKFRLGGRIQADANYSGSDDLYSFAALPAPGKATAVSANDGTEIRRARIDFTGTFFRDWGFKTQIDFADNAVGVKDLFIQYTGINFMDITIGQQKQNFSRELLESSNDMMFTERSLMNVLNQYVVDRAIGLDLQSSAKKGYTASLGVYGNTITPAASSPAGSFEGWSVSGRGTYAPIEEKTKVVHLGIAGNYRAADDNGDVYRSKPLAYQYETNHMSNLDLINSAVTSVDNIKMLGLETSGLYGPVSVGAEYTRQWVDRKSGQPNIEVDGWYVDAGWTLTGESRKYKQGKFYQVDPAKKFSLKNGGWGAWELATRYSNVNTNSGSFKGGEMSNATVALNWYANNNIRFMADYTQAFNFSNAALTATPALRTGAAPQPGNDGTFTLRAQLAY